MATDRVEIRPGVFIEVSQKWRKKAGVPRGATLRKNISEEERRSILGGMAKPPSKSRKYSILLLDEAVRLSALVGEKKACKITGVKYWSLKGRKRVLIRQGKYKSKHQNPGHPRYTLAQKQACVALAQKLMADPATKTVVNPFGHKGTHTRPKWSEDTAFVEAGRRLGVNGSSVRWMYSQGMIP